MKMKINNKIINDKYFGYDGCHKIYIIEDPQDEAEAKSYGYEIMKIEELKDVYETSCELRFIYNWKLTECYAGQYTYANIEQDKKELEESEEEEDER